MSYEKVARVNDQCIKGKGVNITGSSNFIVNNRKGVRKTDELYCSCDGGIIAYMNGSRNVYVNNLDLQAVYDNIICDCGCLQGTGSTDVFVGD